MPITLGLRPRLHLVGKGPPEALARRLREAAGDHPVTVVGDYLVMTIPEERRHFWSPQLQVTLEKQDDGVHVDGLLTPMPAVWTLFAGIYAVVAGLGFFGTIYGLAQWQLGHDAFALWSFPLTLLLIGLVYLAAIVGQHLGGEQSDELTGLLERCLHEQPP